MGIIASHIAISHVVSEYIDDIGLVSRHGVYPDFDL
jgi:hypothetical protein